MDLHSPFRRITCWPCGRQPPTTGGRPIPKHRRSRLSWPPGLLVAVGVYIVSSLLPLSGGLALTGVYFLAIGSYCGVNVWRCREAHCAITSIGWSLLGLLALAVIAPGLQWLGPLWGVFLAIGLVGYAFEAAWSSRHSSNILRRT